MYKKCNVFYYLVDVETGVQLKFGCRKKDISCFNDPFNTEYKFLFSGRVNIWFFKKIKYYFRETEIKGRKVYIVYVLSIPKIFRSRDYVYDSGVLMGLRGKKLNSPKDILKEFVDYCKFIL